MAALNPAQPQIIIQQPAAPQWDLNADLDSRVYAYVILGNVLQGLAVASGIAFAVCIFKVSPLFLFAEIISAIFWAVGEEFKQTGLWPDGSVHIPHFTSNAFVPNQAIGLPKRGQNCCFNAAIQIALASEGVQGLLGHRYDNYPFKGVYDAITEAQQNGGPIAHQADTQRVRESIAQFSNNQISPSPRQQEDAGEILNHLLDQLTAQTLAAAHPYSHSYVEGADDRGYGAAIPQTRLILQPAGYLARLRAGNIPEGTLAQKFLGGLVSPFFFDRNGNNVPLQRKFSALPDELFIQLARMVNEGVGENVRIRKINDLLPIPPNFELPLAVCQNTADDAPNQFEADSFVVHNGHSMRSGHYIAYTRTHTPESGFTWWKINDSRVEPVYTEDAEEALKKAYIVHYRRHPR